MLPTPSTSHVSFKTVYEPSEDSYLFLDTLSSESESRFLTSRLSERHRKSAPPLILEIGTGSGVILAFITAHARKIFGTSDVLTLGTDVNSFACRASSLTVEKACRASTAADCGQFLGVVWTDLAGALKQSCVDVVIFNPPYIPSTDVPSLAINLDGQECSSFRADPLALSYEGGKNGLEITNRFLADLPLFLNRQNGVAYVLLCQQNKPQEVMKRIASDNPNCRVSIVGESGKQAGWEKLCILRVSYIPKTGANVSASCSPRE